MHQVNFLIPLPYFFKSLNIKSIEKFEEVSKSLRKFERVQLLKFEKVSKSFKEFQRVLLLKY